MASKRASMREGPLADLFRSTDESIADDEIRVTATSAGNGAGAATAEAEAPVADPVEIEVEEIEVEKIEVEKVVPAEAPPQAAPETIEEPEETVEPVTGEQSAVEAPRAYRTRTEEEPDTDRRPVEIDHEGLDLVMGVTTPKEVTSRDRPAYGRAEPDTERLPAVPRTHQAVLRVVGVGGAGVNAVNRMVEAEISGVEFMAVNTDLQSLQTSQAESTLHIGAELTRGLGSGSDPRVGYRAAFDEQDKLKELLKGSDMVFVAAGVGGGTGTGAAPVVAKLARDVGALTVGVVSKPFGFEGARRAAQGEEGVAALGAEVDTLIVVPNERLLAVLDRRTSISDAFAVADDVLRQAVQGIADLVTLPGLINLDFADVRTTMIDAGDAILGIGMGVGEHRAVLAAEKAVSSPILDTSVEGAHSLLLSITGGPSLSLIEASEAAKIVSEAAAPDANIIFGANIDEDLDEQVWVTVIATRFESAYSRRHRRDRERSPFEPSSREGEEPQRRREREPTAPGYGRSASGLGIDPPEFIPGH